MTLESIDIASEAVSAFWGTAIFCGKLIFEEILSLIFYFEIADGASLIESTISLWVNDFYTELDYLESW